MKDKMVKIAEDFWNIRGEFKLFGLVNIGTQASLVKRQNGNFVFLDAYSMHANLKKLVDIRTNNGQYIEAIINLHPFHTIHVEQAHQDYPHAKLYGTQRHVDKFPHLPWQPELTDSTEFATLYADDFDFTVPQGVDFISSDEKVHFSSVLAYHKASKTIHVDDTLMYFPLPGLLGLIKSPQVSLHMTLSKALQQRPGAVEDFRSWVKQLAISWHDSKVLCAAHSEILFIKDNSPTIAQRIIEALDKEEKTLKAHQKKFG